MHIYELELTNGSRTFIKVELDLPSLCECISNGDWFRDHNGWWINSKHVSHLREVQA